MKLLSKLVTDGTEYFTAGQIWHKVSANGIQVLSDFPADFYSLLKQKLSTDRPALKSLKTLEILEEKQQIEKYYDCNYSACGRDADVTKNGQLGEREIVRCDKRDSCKHEGKLCLLPLGITKREAQVARAIANGKMDAEITADYFISQNTLRNHKNNIERKIGQTGKTAIGVWIEHVGLR